MSLSDSLDEYLSKNNLEICPFGRVLESLNESDRLALAKAIAKGVPASAIILALKNEGHKIGNDSYYNHKKGLCKCPK